MNLIIGSKYITSVVMYLDVVIAQEHLEQQKTKQKIPLPITDI